MDDCQLINEYAQSGSESAFRTLVERHLNLVRSCALRHVNDPSLADEVSQAVFILLARKAHTLKRGVVLPGWLFRTTRFVASRALRTEYRRQQRDQEAFAMQHSTQSEDTWKKIVPLLDDALEHLGNTDRNAVLLRFLQDRNHKEVGQALGLSEEAARKRVDRALEKLRGFFVKHGFTLSATMLASALAANTAKASPLPLVNSITSTAVASGSTAAAIVLPALVTETLAAWRWAKLKFAGATVASGVVAICIMLALQQTPTSADTNARTASAVKTADVSQTNGTRKQDPFFSPPSTNRVSKSKTLLLRVIAKDTDEPIANAKLAINSVYNGKWEDRFDLSTDANGICPVPLPNGLGRLDVGAIASGWGARYVTWKAEPIPGEYTLKLESVTNSVGGWLHDEAGNPVPNAEIWVDFAGGSDASWRETPRERVGLHNKGPVAKSDLNGHWTASIIPAENPGFHLEAQHPDFAATPIASRSPRFEPGEQLRQLWAGTLITVLDRSLTLTGRVIDESGNPVSGAKIIHQPHSKALTVKTEADGTFNFPNMKPGYFDFSVTADGFAPEYRKLDVKKGMEPVEVRLQPGALLKLLVVDVHGAPVPGVTVGLEQWGEHRFVLKWEGKSDANGHIEWNSAPPSDTLEFYAKKAGWCYTRSIRAVADGQEHTVVMERALNLSVHVTDAATGEAIPRFNAFPGYGEGPGEQVWQQGSTTKGVNGNVKVTFDETEKPWRVRIEAEGYLPFTSKELNADSRETLEVSLKMASVEESVRGTVFLPNGKPAANAQVALLSLDYGAELKRGRLSDSDGGMVTNADPAGLFVFPANPRAHSVAAASPAGYVRLRVRDPKNPVSLQLQPWGRIEATLTRSIDLRTVDRVSLADDSAGNYEGAVRLDPNYFGVKPDTSGRVVFENVPQGQFSIYVYFVKGKSRSHRTTVLVRAGETSTVEVGSQGRTISGQLVATPGLVTNWVKQTRASILSSTVEPISPPENLSGDAAALWAVDFWQSDAAAKHNRDQSFGVTVAEDGSFHTEAVEPGTYNLLIIIANMPLEKEVIVPETSDANREINLGTLPLSIKDN